MICTRKSRFLICCCICISLLSCTGLALAFDKHPPGVQGLILAGDREGNPMEMATRDAEGLPFRGLLIGVGTQVTLDGSRSHDPPVEESCLN